MHAEQSSVTNAWTNGEEDIDRIAVNAAPCGYCRQFLNELVTADRLVIAMPNETRPLRDLLPSAFGPRDLGVDGGLMQRAHNGLAIEESDALANAALDAANMSYAPYSKSYAGAAVRTRNAIYAGPYAGERGVQSEHVAASLRAAVRENHRGTLPAIRNEGRPAARSAPSPRPADTLGTHVAKAGIDVSDASEQLGHTEISSTMIYFQITDRRRTKVHRRLRRSPEIVRR